MTSKDWPAVAAVYADGIATGSATFETTVPSFEVWDQSHVKSCRLVAEKNDTVIGWAALSPVSSRCVYGGVAELSIYIAGSSRGQGVGKAILHQLISQSEAAGYWTLQAGIFPENKASIKLHESMGFRFLGKRERIGKTPSGIWKDNLLFERRSKVVGT